MPYLTCPACRLTVFSVAGHSHASDDCPRCGAQLAERPRRLFERGPGNDPFRRGEAGDEAPSPVEERASTG